MEEDETGNEKEKGNSINDFETENSNVDDENKMEIKEKEMEEIITEEDEDEDEEEEPHIEFVKVPYWLEFIVVYGMFVLIIYIGNTFQKVKIV